MKTNAQVAAAFVARETAQNKSLRSTGSMLYSYATPIAYHLIDNRIVVSTQHHSPTTTRHHSELWSAAHAAGYDGPGIYTYSPEDARPFGEHEGRSDPDAPAVVWRKLTEEEREAKRQRDREELDRLIEKARQEFAR